MLPETRSTPTLHVRSKRHSRWISGLGLIMIGALVLIEQYVESQWLGLLFLLALGGVFLRWGSMTRNIGLLIPGGVLTGLGLGVALEGWLLGDLSGDAKAAVFLLTLALGWGLISLLSALFTEKAQWWPLILGGLMAAVGGALLLGGRARQALEFAGGSFSRAWPFALIALGMYLLLRRKVEGIHGDRPL